MGVGVHESRGKGDTHSFRMRVLWTQAPLLVCLFGSLPAPAVSHVSQGLVESEQFQELSPSICGCCQ